MVRHGPAEEPQPGQRDGDRALTEGGRIWSRGAFRGLAARATCPSLILASPFLRAQQTAELLAGAFAAGTTKVETWPDLVPSGAAVLVETQLRARLAEAPEDACLALVTHQPLVSDLVARLADRRVAFPPAGWAMLTFERGVFRLVESSEDRP